MKTYALIKVGKVDNIIIAEDSWPIGIDITALNPQPAIGWSYTNGVFAAPPPPAPQPQNRTGRADIYSRMTAGEVHAWRRAVIRAEATDTPVAKDLQGLYAWYRFNALPDEVDLTSNELKGLKNVWVALGMTAARADTVLAPAMV